LVKEYLRRTHADGAQERTGALYLNARNRLLRDDPEIYRGTLDRAVVEPRELLKRALLSNAAALIVYHNHPSGDPSPSREDREFTRRLASAADLVGLRLLDHVVVGREGCVSFREAGLLQGSGLHLPVCWPMGQGQLGGCSAAVIRGVPTP